MKTIKKILKSTLFLSGLVVILMLTSVAFADKTISDIRAEPDNSIDYLVIGDSESYTTISPMEIWHKYGYTGYNLGVPLQNVQDAYNSLGKALEHQNPKYVFIESNFFFRNKGLVGQTEYFVSNTFKKWFPIFDDHNNWKNYFDGIDFPNLVKPDFVPSPMKGYRYRGSIKPYSKGDYIHKNKKKVVIDKSQMKLIEDLIDLCESKGAKVIIYSAPSPVNWNYGRYLTLTQYAETRKVEYIDLNLLLKELKIDWKKDTYDKGDHLNHFGAVKSSAYFGKLLDDKKALVDRRRFPAFKQWDKDYEKYRTEVSK